MRTSAAPSTTTGGEATPTGSSKVARQIAVLGLVLCVVAVSLAYPLRNYLTQRSELAAAVSLQRANEQKIAELQQDLAALDDPQRIAAEAKSRLQYVRPGDTVYVVQVPNRAAAAAPDGFGAAASVGGPWYATLWNTLAAPPAVAVDPGPAGSAANP